MKQECWPKFQQIITDMRTAAASRPMIPPTPLQEAILRTLQMRTTLTVDELKMAELLTEYGALAYSVTADEWGRQSVAVPVDTVAKFSEIVDGEGVDA